MNDDIIFPPRNLPDRAEQWGRSVEGELKALRKAGLQSGQQLDNGQRSTSGQLAVIAQQISDLVGRVSYQRVTGSLGSFPIGETTVPGTAMTFVLDSPRVIQVSQFSMVSTTSMPMRVGISLNGARHFDSGQSSTTYVGDYGDPKTGASHFGGLYTLPAGTHSISGAVLVQGPGSGVNTVYSLYTVVNVLQRVA